MYILGKTPPEVGRDVGSGKYCNDPITPEAISLKVLLEGSLPSGSRISVVPSIKYMVDRNLPEAVKNMNHYLGNTGETLHVDMKTYMSKSERLTNKYKNDLDEAKSFAETMPPGNFSITHDAVQYGQFGQDKRVLMSFMGESDLYFAIGGYQWWGQAEFTVEKLKNGNHHCDMVYSFHFFDRYNWDGSKHVTVGGQDINDELLQTLHKQCLAREYDIKGLLETKVSWDYKPGNIYSQAKSNNDGVPRGAIGERFEEAGQDVKQVGRAHQQGLINKSSIFGGR